MPSLDALPPLLRTVLDAELAAGNRVIDIHFSHPAPPVGFCVVLADQLSTPIPAGLRYRQRNSSTHSSELTDALGHHWLLTAPVPPPPIPDMDAIRAAHNPPPPAPPAPPVSFTITIDFRGEMITYSEPSRSTSFIFTCWDHDAILYAGTCQSWRYAGSKPAEPLSAGERDQVVQRVLDHCRHAGVGNVRLK